ncbi:MAG TPA: adenylate/guanylate cyclase domain-containing protein [Anaerolineae bacterium]|nr:adenylate/guanylate cyclase domain-containing protein [Anaerolineae bacterium]
MEATKGHILIVDDNRLNRIKLLRLLENDGYTAEMVNSGEAALTLLAEASFDIVLLDIMMPGMDGYGVLKVMKGDERWRNIPVIVISAIDEIESVVRCIELGAEDYLAKPFNPVLLRARIFASLEKKRLRDQEQAFLLQLRQEQDKVERLLLNVLPRPIAERLKQGQNIIADSFNNVTVLFADIVDFTPLASTLSANELVMLLNELFSTFDRLALQFGLEKIKTIGDAYMVVGGLPQERGDHAIAVAEMALAMQASMANFEAGVVRSLQLRIGIHSGPVIAGVIGESKFSYDLWGDTVNVASRMETQGVTGRIQVSSVTYDLLIDDYCFEERGVVDVKGKGEMMSYFLLGKK